MGWVSVDGRSMEPHYSATWEPDGHILNKNHRARDLRWKGNWLYIVGGRKLLQLVPDERYVGMWRVELPGGKLMEPTNRTRAKDTAMVWALRA